MGSDSQDGSPSSSSRSSVMHALPGRKGSLAASSHSHSQTLSGNRSKRIHNDALSVITDELSDVVDEVVVDVPTPQSSRLPAYTLRQNGPYASPRPVSSLSSRQLPSTRSKRRPTARPLSGRVSLRSSSLALHKYDERTPCSPSPSISSARSMNRLRAPEQALSPLGGPLAIQDAGKKKEGLGGIDMDEDLETIWEDKKAAKHRDENQLHYEYCIILTVSKDSSPERSSQNAREWDILHSRLHTLLMRLQVGGFNPRVEMKLVPSGEMKVLILLAAETEVLAIEMKKDTRERWLKLGGGVGSSDIDIVENDSLPDLSPADRIYLTDRLLHSSCEDGGVSIDEFDDIVDRAFPLHDERFTRQLLTRWWTNWRDYFRDIDPFVQEIRFHYGERTALYFAYMDLYTKWLTIPAFAGIFFYLTSFLSEGFYFRSLAFLGLGISGVWGPMFLRSWSRRCSELALMWNVRGEEDRTYENKGFRGERHIDPITGELAQSYSRRKRTLKILCGGLLFILFVVIEVVLTVGFVDMYIFIKLGCGGQCPKPPSFINWLLVIVQGILLGLSIDIIQYQIFRSLVFWLADWENYRTENGYYNSLTLKMFSWDYFGIYSWFWMLAFVYVPFGNEFTALVNSAGILPWTSQYEDGVVDLGEVFVTPIIVTQGLNMIVNTFGPWILYKVHIKAETAAALLVEKTLIFYKEVQEINLSTKKFSQGLSHKMKSVPKGLATTSGSMIGKMKPKSGESSGSSALSMPQSCRSSSSALSLFASSFFSPSSNKTTLTAPTKDPAGVIYIGNMQETEEEAPNKLEKPRVFTFDQEDKVGEGQYHESIKVSQDLSAEDHDNDDSSGPKGRRHKRQRSQSLTTVALRSLASSPQRKKDSPKVSINRVTSPPNRRGSAPMARPIRSPMRRDTPSLTVMAKMRDEFRNQSSDVPGTTVHGAPIRALLRRKTEPHLNAYLDRVLQQAIQEEYHPFAEYADTVVQYGYLTQFSVVWPFIAFCGLVNNLFEVRASAFKLCYTSSRPVPRKAKDIGLWAQCLRFSNFLSVIITLAVICFCSGILEWFAGCDPPSLETTTDDRLSPMVPSYDCISGPTRLVILLIVEHIMLATILTVENLLSRQPRWVKMYLRKEEYEYKKMVTEAYTAQHRSNVKENNKKELYGKRVPGLLEEFDVRWECAKEMKIQNDRKRSERLRKRRFSLYRSSVVNEGLFAPQSAVQTPARGPLLA